MNTFRSVKSWFIRAAYLTLWVLVFTVHLFFSKSVLAAEFNHLVDSELSRADGITKIALFELDFQMERVLAGSTEVRADWTENSEKNFLTTLSQYTQGSGIEFNLLDIPDELDYVRHRQVEKLNQVVGISIIQNDTLKLPTKKENPTWTVGSGAQLIQELSGADYALFVHMRRGYTSGGRVAVSLLAAALTGVAVVTHYQFGFASLVDLQTGKVVWFNQLTLPRGDLRQLDKSLPAVSALLANFPGIEFSELPKNSSEE